MLTIEALNSTKELVAILADKGVTLRPVAGSPIAEAMSATRIYGNSIDCLSAIDGLPANLYQSNEPIITNGEVQEHLHDTYMESATSALGVALAGHVSFATTVVLPAVHELHNKLKEIQNLEDRCGIRSFKVEMVTGSALFDVPAIVSQIEKFGTLQPAGDQALVLDYKELTDEELITLMKIGAEVYDTAIDQFVQNESIELVREVWNVVFAGQRGNWKTFDSFRADREKGQARSFATFLIATRLLIGGEGMPLGTGVSGLSSAKYTFALKNLQEVAGKALFIALEYRAQQDKAGKLIDKIDNKVVYVNKSVYDRFMADGGDVETILGAAVSGEKKTYVADIIQKVEQYKQAWTYHVTLAKQNAETGMLIDVRRGISDFVRQYIKTTDDGVVRANVDKILDNLDEFTQHTYKPELKDIDILAMRAVCLVIFNHTDAIELLRGVNEAMSMNPDISKEDALNLAVLQYVACWFADQVEIA